MDVWTFILVSGLVFRVFGLVMRVSGLVIRVCGLVVWVSGLAFWIWTCIVGVRTDGRTAGWTDGWTERWADGRAGGWTDGRAGGRTIAVKIHKLAWDCRWLFFFPSMQVHLHGGDQRTYKWKSICM